MALEVTEIQINLDVLKDEEKLGELLQAGCCCGGGSESKLPF